MPRPLQLPVARTIGSAACALILFVVAAIAYVAPSWSSVVAARIRVTPSPYHCRAAVLYTVDINNGDPHYRYVTVHLVLYHGNSAAASVLKQFTPINKDAPGQSVSSVAFPLYTPGGVRGVACPDTIVAKAWLTGKLDTSETPTIRCWALHKNAYVSCAPSPPSP